MNKSVIKVASILTASSLVLGGCSLLKDLDYTVTPNPLEMHGDSVEISIVVEVPEKGLNKKAEALVTPVYGGTELKPIMIQGEKVTGNGQTIAFKEGGKVTYTDIVAYTPEMENTTLSANVKAYKTGKEDKAEPFTVDSVAVGTDITPYLVQGDDKVIMGKDNFVRITQHEVEAILNFDKAKHSVSKSEIRDEDFIALDNWMLGADTNERIVPTAVKVTSFASPEGETAENSELAGDRGESSMKVVKNLANKNSIDFADEDSDFTLEPKGEDWDGAQMYLNNSSLSEEEKQKVMSVLKMYTNPADRQRQINAMSKINKTLEEEVLEPLRRSNVTIEYDLHGKTDEELKELAMSNPDSLVLEEIMFAATLFDDENDQLKVFKEAQRLFPNDWRGFNNAGFILYNQDNLEAAKSEFEKANQLNENPVTLNNLGAIARRSGDREKARELFNSAKAAGPEVTYNLGIIAIQDGEYPIAISSFGGEKTFNKGLAMYLNGDTDGAVNTIDQSDHAETAMGYYLKAVIGSAKSNWDMVNNNLKSAFSLDASLKAKAAKDMAFYKYFTNAEFVALTK
jgi:Flp pilus assembly protein TadD